MTYPRVVFLYSLLEFVPEDSITYKPIGYKLVQNHFKF